tara:strand:+ start:133 stop:279 length:147 start_codon:yes stop_codon:yes gene_type:complete
MRIGIGPESPVILRRMASLTGAGAVSWWLGGFWSGVFKAIFSVRNSRI